jgi:CRISPR-associated protein Csm4
MEAVILKCHPGGHFHFGNFALDSNMSLDTTSHIPHSDTLFSAIVRIAAQIGSRENTDRLVEAFRNGDFLISSANFCLEFNNKFIYFLPKPISAGLDEEQEYKRIRKIDFVSKNVIDKAYRAEQWLDGSLCTIIQDRFVIARDELSELEGMEAKHQKIYSTSSSPKVKVHTEDLIDTLYNQSVVEIGSLGYGDKTAKVHYYFFLEIRENTNPELINLLNSAINLIPESGIGGEKSTGCGNIKAIEKDTDISFANTETSLFLSLSLIAPQKEEENSFQYFDLLTRGGRHTGYEKKHLKVIRLIKEGAVLSNPVDGKLVDISPKVASDIPYLRNGKAFLIPLHENYSKNEKQ